MAAGPEVERNGKSKQKAADDMQKSGAAVPPRKLPPYQPFPVDALPTVLAQFVAQGARALGCDPAYFALPCLAACASMIGNSRTVQLKRDWPEPCVIWSCLAADSGTLKSAAFRLAMRPIFQLQKELTSDFKRSLNEFNLRESRRPGDKPVCKRVVCSDITVEKIAEILDDNPRGTLVFRDELAGWFGSFTKYKGKAGVSDLPNWLEMFTASTLMVDRKTGERGSLFVPRAATSVTGTIQTGVLVRALTADFIEAGGAARLLIAMPPKLTKRWTDCEIAPDTAAAYDGLIRKLHKNLDLVPGTNEDERVPAAVHLSAEARKVWVSFYNAWAFEQNNAEGELASVYSKLEAYAARLALLHYLVNRVARQELGQADPDPRQQNLAVEDVRAGIRLTRWFAGEARRIYSTLTETEEGRRVRRLIEFLRSQDGPATIRRLQRSNPGRYPNADAAEEALEGLVNAGLGKWKEVPTTAKGGSPTKVFYLTPDTTDTTSDDDHGDDLTEPPDTTSDDAEIPAENGGSVSCVRRQVKEEGPDAERDGGEVVSGDERDGGEVVSGDDEDDDPDPFG